MKPTQTFIVRQSLFFNLLMAAIFLSIFVGILFTISGQVAFDIPEYIKFIAFFCIPGIGAIYAGVRNSEVFRIDEEGIFYCKKMITSWDRFIQAYAEENNPETGFAVSFSLHIEYYDSETGIASRIRIPLSQTLDKSIEEIVSAIGSLNTTNLQTQHNAGLEMADGHEA